MSDVTRILAAIERGDVRAVDELFPLVYQELRRLAAQKIADHKAIYATGHSSGGLFCYRLAKETALFAAVSPMSCGMVKGAHDPDEKTKSISIMQVIGDQDKSFNGSSNTKVTMYSAGERIDVWRMFNRCRPGPVVVEKGEEVVLYTYANQAGIEVAFCKVKDQGHFIRRDLRDSVDSIAIDFLLKHKRMLNRNGDTCLIKCRKRVQQRAGEVD